MNIHTETARQTDGILSVIHDQLRDGWSRGRRFGKGGPCLTGAIDATTGWCIPEAKKEVEAKLCTNLPPAFRAVSRINKRVSLILFNDFSSQDKVVNLVEQTYSTPLELVA